MSRLLGFGLIVTGMVIGGVVVPLSASAPPAPEVPPAVTPIAPKAAPGDSTAGKQAHVPPAPVMKPLPPAATALAPSSAAPAPVEPPAVRAPAAPVPRKPIVTPFETVVHPEDPAAITRALQIELARVGCYAGPATGFWGPETRRAMKAFTNRVNATLPIDKPDVILLSLVRAQAAGVCSQACPAGQQGAADGRCVPKAVLAQAARKAAPVAGKAAEPKPDAKPEVVVAAASPSAVTGPPTVGAVLADTPRMALAGPLTEEGAATPAPAAGTEKASAKQAKKRERRDAPAAGNAKYGQTKWAREFFRSSGVF